MSYCKLRISRSAVCQRLVALRAIVSILISSLVGSLLLQSYFAIWHTSPFWHFAELPIVFVLAAGISATTLIVVAPTFTLLQRNQRSISVLVSFAIGLSLGFLVTLLYMVLSRWPLRAAELAAGSAAGAAGTVTYAQILAVQRWRVSLPTLLIAMTLLGFALGLAGYALME
jgi:hypothetical protein